MGFHNKWLSEKERESFVSATKDFVKTTFKYHGKSSLEPSFWTVDKERQICLIGWGTISRDEPNEKLIFFKEGSKLFILTIKKNTEQLTKTSSIIHWSSLKILASSENYDIDELKYYIAEALIAYGFFGDEDIEEQFEGITVKYDINL